MSEYPSYDDLSETKNVLWNLLGPSLCAVALRLPALGGKYESVQRGIEVTPKFQVPVFVIPDLPAGAIFRRECRISRMVG